MLGLMIKSYWTWY